MTKDYEKSVVCSYCLNEVCYECMNRYLNIAMKEKDVFPCCPICKKEYFNDSLISLKTRSKYLEFFAKYVQNNPRVNKILTIVQESSSTVKKIRDMRINFMLEMPFCIQVLVNLCYKKEYDIIKKNKELMFLEKMERKYKEKEQISIRCFNRECYKGKLYPNSIGHYSCDTCFTEFCFNCEQQLLNNHYCSQEKIEILKEDKGNSLSTHFSKYYESEIINEIVRLEDNIVQIDSRALEEYFPSENSSSEDIELFFSIYCMVKNKVLKNRNYCQLLMHIRNLNLNSDLTFHSLIKTIQDRNLKNIKPRFHNEDVGVRRPSRSFLQEERTSEVRTGKLYEGITVFTGDESATRRKPIRRNRNNEEPEENIRPRVQMKEDPINLIKFKIPVSQIKTERNYITNSNDDEEDDISGKMSEMNISKENIDSAKSENKVEPSVEEEKFRTKPVDENIVPRRRPTQESTFTSRIRPTEESNSAKPPVVESRFGKRPTQENTFTSRIRPTEESNSAKPPVVESRFGRRPISQKEVDENTFGRRPAEESFNSRSRPTFQRISTEESPTRNSVRRFRGNI